MPLAGARILQVIPELDAGGAERTTIEIAEALTRAGASALVASAGGRLEGELAAAGGELIRLPHIGSKAPPAIWANSLTLSRLIAERGVELVHARSRAPAWSALWAARRRSIPFVTTYHGVYASGSPAKRLWNSVMARGDVVIANSEFTAAHVRREHPDAAARIVTIPRGVDLARFSPEAVAPERAAALAAAWGLPAAGRPDVILLPARLTAWKGHREAVLAAARLATLSPRPWRMMFAGDAQGRDDYVGGLRGLIARHGLDGRIAIVGHCADMPAAFALADLVIAPSNQPEAFGRVAAEAGAMARAAVVSDLGAQREVVVDGETGLRTAPGDPEALALAMSRLLAHPEERRRMGAAARARVEAFYTARALQDATLSVYARLLGWSVAP
jgi:glycosyltransferase involved in cell wall biosynthesis